MQWSRAKSGNWSNKSYLQHIPVSPDYYYRDRFSNEFDVAIVGRTGRDRLTVERALSSSNFKWVTTEDTNSWLKIGGAFSDGYGERKCISPRYQSDVIDVLAKSRCVWIPISSGQEEPVGYTTLVESLLTGTPAIISDTSTIPSTLLSLPGVYRYSADNAESLIEKTQEAVQQSSDFESRRLIRYRATQILSRNDISPVIAKVLDT